MVFAILTFASGCQSLGDSDSCGLFSSGDRIRLGDVSAGLVDRPKDDPKRNLKGGRRPMSDEPETTVFHGPRRAVPDPKEL